MNPRNYEEEADAIILQLPEGPRVGVIGSARLWGDDTWEICEAIGSELATLAGLVLLTGGVPGVGEAVGRSFFATRQQSSAQPNTFHVLPIGSRAWDYGVTLFAGSSMPERREILGRLATVYLVAEGGPGTEHEAEVAQRRDATLVPISRTGGYSNELYPQLDCPKPEVRIPWNLLDDRSASPGEVGAAVRQIVEALRSPEDTKPGW